MLSVGLSLKISIRKKFSNKKKVYRIVTLFLELLIWTVSYVSYYVQLALYTLVRTSQNNARPMWDGKLFVIVVFESRLNFVSLIWNIVKNLKRENDPWTKLALLVLCFFFFQKQFKICYNDHRNKVKSRSVIITVIYWNFDRLLASTCTPFYKSFFMKRSAIKRTCHWHLSSISNVRQYQLFQYIR